MKIWSFILFGLLLLSLPAGCDDPAEDDVQSVGVDAVDGTTDMDDDVLDPEDLSMDSYQDVLEDIPGRIDLLPRDQASDQPYYDVLPPDVPPTDSWDVPPTDSWDVPPTDSWDVPPDCDVGDGVQCDTCDTWWDVPPDDSWDVVEDVPPDGGVWNPTGMPCWSDEECGEAYECVTPPCPFCGMPPMPICVPKHCSDACWEQSHCSAGEKCVGASIDAAEMGRCLTPTSPPDCWVDEDCPENATCQGESYSPACVDSGMIEAPGSCVPDFGHEGVVLWVDSSDIFLVGDKAWPVWYNFSQQKVFLAGCTTTTLEKMDEVTGGWVDLGPAAYCFWEGIAHMLEPGDAFEALEYSLLLAQTETYGTFRVKGQFWTGCSEGQPISAGGCTGGPYEITSDTLGVSMYAPP